MAGYAAGLMGGNSGQIDPGTGEALMGKYASLLAPNDAMAGPGGFQLALTGDQLTPGQASIVQSIVDIFNSGGKDMSALAQPGGK